MRVDCSIDEFLDCGRARSHDVGEQLDGEVVFQKRRVRKELGGRAPEFCGPLSHNVAHARRRRPMLGNAFWWPETE